MSKKLVGAVLALSLTTSAVAEDDRGPATADTEAIVVGSSDTGTVDDSMTDFMASIADVLAENDRSDSIADDSSDNGDDRLNSDRGSRHQRHLGLGFAHGMGNQSPKGKGKGKRKGNGNPHNDDCRGNGHLGNTNGTGNGRGHENYNGNGFGHRDCGEPSPSD